MVNPLLELFKYAKHCLDPDVSSIDPQYAEQHAALEAKYLAAAKPRHHHAIKLALLDYFGRRNEALIKLPGPLERFVTGWLLAEERDLPLFLTFVQCGLWLTFSACVQLLLLPNNAWGLLWMVVHLPITWIVLGQRFILAMHYAAHRSLFHPRWGHVGTLLNHFPMLVLCNFWGMPCGAYYLQHCVMHHQANNCFPYDISSTMPYDRSSPLQWVRHARRSPRAASSAQCCFGAILRNSPTLRIHPPLRCTTRATSCCTRSSTCRSTR